MKVLGVIFALCCLIVATFAAQGVLLDATHPDHPGKCYDESSKTVFEPKETKSLPGSCAQAFCSDTFSLTISTCGVVRIDDPECQEIEQDLTKDYPECCKKYRCVHDGKVVYH